MEQAFIIDYLESERFSRFIKKQKVEVFYEDDKLTIYVKENIPEYTDDKYLDCFVEYRFSKNTDTFIDLTIYQLEGLEELEKELEYPDDLRAMIKKISDSIK